MQNNKKQEEGWPANRSRRRIRRSWWHLDFYGQLQGVSCTSHRPRHPVQGVDKPRMLFPYGASIRASRIYHLRWVEALLKFLKANTKVTRRFASRRRR